MDAIRLNRNDCRTLNDDVRNIPNQIAACNEPKIALMAERKKTYWKIKKNENLIRFWFNQMMMGHKVSIVCVRNGHMREKSHKKVHHHHQQTFHSLIMSTKNSRIFNQMCPIWINITIVSCTHTQMLDILVSNWIVWTNTKHLTKSLKQKFEHFTIFCQFKCFVLFGCNRIIFLLQKYAF